MQFPKTRSECANGLRPCPWVRCKHHMLWGLIPRMGHAKAMTQDEIIAEFIDDHTDEEILCMMDKLPESCTLDVAERTATLQGIADLFGVTRERVRQCELFKQGGAIKKIRNSHRDEIKRYRDFI